MGSQTTRKACKTEHLTNHILHRKPTVEFIIVGPSVFSDELYLGSSFKYFSVHIQCFGYVLLVLHVKMWVP